MRRVSVEIIDPRKDPETEADINRKGIKPVPFQMSDRHSASIVNSYFNIVVQYGDQQKILGFNDLIDVKHSGVGEPEVRLRDFEYSITSNIKMAYSSFNNTDNFFANLKRNIKFVCICFRRNYTRYP